VAVVDLHGPEWSGKTTLALHVVAKAQKLGGVCAFVDAEHALDVGSARKLGVKTDDSSRSRIAASRRWRSPTCW
jgi:recombination protein RecA